MKKLVLFLALGFYATANNMHAQSIINPIEVELTGIDKNASDILVVNRSTGDVMLFPTANEFYVAYSSLLPGIYSVRYTLDGERHKQYIKISSSERQTATSGFTFFRRNN